MAVYRTKSFGAPVFLLLLVLAITAYFLTIPDSTRTSNAFRTNLISENQDISEFDLRFISYGSENGSGVNLSCVFPHVNPFDPNIMKIAGLDEQTIDCADFPPDLTYVSGNKLRVNHTLIKIRYGDGIFQHCKYQTLHKVPGEDNLFQERSWSEPFKESINVAEDTEYIRVFCLNRESKIISRTYLALIPKKEFLDELQTVRLKKRMVEYSPIESLNVVMVGIDSLSRHHLIRAMQKTYTYLMTNLTSFDLTMHSQLAGHTFPNFLALFTGQTEDEISKWWDSTKYTDSFELIYRTFEAAGYRTVYSEDSPLGGAFHYQKQGFQHRIFMYNSRPIALAMHYDQDLWGLNDNCAGSRVEVEFHLDYLTRFLQMFSNTPVFALSFLTKLCHDRLVNAKRGDEYFYNFIKNLHDKGLLNNTLLIFFSDHGPRWGEIRDTFSGMIESRNPYTILTFPKWFVQKYKKHISNLKINTKRLTTHFDTHATLLDLLYFETKSTPPYRPPTHGISLFQPIPENRTCEDIPIPPEFCLCGQKDMEYQNNNSKLAQLFATIVMSTVNKLKDNKLCAYLTLKNIVSLVKITLPEAARRERFLKVIYKIRLQTSPGDALYEATVFYQPYSNHAILGHELERLNMYRGQAECVHDATVRLYCYCKHLLHRETQKFNKNDIEV